MVSITLNGKSLKVWWQQKLREAFVRREVKPGRIMIVWQDVDRMVYGWDMCADEEFGLGQVARLIGEAKRKKLIETVNGKEEKTNGKR